MKLLLPEMKRAFSERSPLPQLLNTVSHVEQFWIVLLSALKKKTKTERDFLNPNAV